MSQPQRLSYSSLPHLLPTHLVIKFTNALVFDGVRNQLVHDDVWVRGGRVIDPVRIV